jgi:hypothetical protein
MTVYLQVPTRHADDCRAVLKSVAYWGQANSLAWCVRVYPAAPRDGEVAVPLRSLNGFSPLRQFFACIVSEFRDTQMEWDEVMPTLRRRKKDTIRMELYVWPMVMGEQHCGGRLLHRHSLSGWR